MLRRQGAGISGAADRRRSELGYARQRALRFAQGEGRSRPQYAPSTA